MKQKGFENIDQTNGFIYMYQMFLIGFVKRQLSEHVVKVISR